MVAKWFSLFVCIFAITLSSNEINAANIFHQKKGAFSGDIIIEGEIVSGDYVKFINQVLEVGIKKGEVFISSNGGDVKEAMMIGKLIRDLNFSTVVPVGDSKSGPLCVGYDVSHCSCESACFLIYLSGYERSGEILGVHRAFIEHEKLKMLSPAQAKKYSRVVSSAVNSYMLDMGISKSLVDEILNISSSEVKYLQHELIETYLEGYHSDIEEWVIASCGDSDSMFEELRKASKEDKSRINKELVNTIYCQDDLALSARQEAFYPIIVNVLMEEKLNPFPHFLQDYSFVQKTDFRDLIGKPFQDAVDVLKFYGVGKKELPVDEDYSSLFLVDFHPGNISISTDYEGDVHSVLIRLHEFDDREGYGGYLFNVLDSNSKYDDFVAAFGQPRKPLFSDGEWKGLLKEVDFEIDGDIKMPKRMVYRFEKDGIKVSISFQKNGSIHDVLLSQK